MNEQIRYTKSGKKIEVFYLKSKLHDKVILEKVQYELHIIKKHPEINLEIIQSILVDPDLVSKQSKSKKEHFYQKKILNNNFFVVVAANKNAKNIRYILSAYIVEDKNYLKEKNIHIVYSKY